MIATVDEYLHMTGLTKLPRFLILRGLAGAGKTYLANKLCEVYEGEPCIIRTSVLIDIGDRPLYTENSSLLNIDLFKRNLIIWDDVNEKNIFSPYISMALSAGYLVDVAYVENERHRKDYTLGRGFVFLMPSHYDHVAGSEHHRAKNRPLILHLVNQY